MQTSSHWSNGWEHQAVHDAYTEAGHYSQLLCSLSLRTFCNTHPHDHQFQAMWKPLWVLLQRRLVETHRNQKTARARLHTLFHVLGPCRSRRDMWDWLGARHIANDNSTCLPHHKCERFTTFVRTSTTIDQASATCYAADFAQYYGNFVNGVKNDSCRVCASA